MNKIYLIILSVFFLSCEREIMCECNESAVQSTCNGIIYDEYSQYCVYGNIKDKEIFIDSRDGKKYKTVVIGSQTWMAENLNYEIDGNKCYGEGGQIQDDDDDCYCGSGGSGGSGDTEYKQCSILLSLPDTEVQANCAKYGRLYDWETAMNACPEGWHLPMSYEWNILENYIGRSSRQLKARSSDWKSCLINGVDGYGFSALPSGALYHSGEFSPVGHLSAWWTAKKDGQGNVYYYVMRQNDFYLGETRKSAIEMPLLSIRCIKDYPVMIDTGDVVYSLEAEADSTKFLYGEWSYGEFKPVPEMPKPLFTELPYQGPVEYVGYGGYGRIMRYLTDELDKNEISQIKVRITVTDSVFKKYSDVMPVDVIFYRTGEEKDGKYVFQTLNHAPLEPGYDPEKHGRLILFSKDINNQGIWGNFLIIYVKNPTDNIVYEIMEPKLSNGNMWVDGRSHYLFNEMDIKWQ